jgi:DNA-directed RNA polymerase specialized sigma24 family protein
MAECSTASFFSTDRFLHTWDEDIRRASRAAARRLGGTAEDAEDFAQEVRIRLFPIAALPQAAAPRYVRKLVANAVKTSVSRTDTTVFEDIDETAEQLMVEPPDPRIADVAAWVATRTFPLRAIYQHLYVEGLTQRETARVMRISQPRVAQLHQRLLDVGRVDLQHLAA